MKILLLIDSLGSGGRERRLIELIKGLREQPQIQLKLIIFSDNIHYKEIYRTGIPVIILKRVPKRNPLVFYRLFSICRKWQADIIHSWGTMSSIWAIPSAVFLKTPLINGNIVDAPKDMKFFDKRLFRARLTYPFSRVVVGNSMAGLDAYKVPENKRVCIYNGFDLNRLNLLKEKKSVRTEFSIESEYVIGMVGSFSDRKDYGTLIEAAFQILNIRKDVSFVFVGDGPEFAKSKTMIPNDLQPYFKFVGLQNDVESIINIFNIGVMSTNTHRHGEGISNAILEYMALEKPTIATRGGGTDEVVDHLVTGILVDPHSPVIMAKEILHLLENPEQCLLMGENARKRLENNFGLDKMTNSYSQLYNSHIAN
ncbi:glycosyltransferase [Muriicola sp. Z0-33]|uniref:glycosyltransferase n=1 Tax=Muriicola sp. Z0-33 TaxID=2816957 RepID=UPI00223801A1|nr:glycosyltransferase [Muriicola sp. Z0-33]MCW5515662.1 glycosyltransferase [Muriicola sp. Z0-33]